MDLKAVAHLGRFREITTTLVKYGFDDIVDRLDIPGRKYLEKIRVHTQHLTTWERIRKVLEELGPTYIKCGQILSQRADLLPRELLEELRKLQDEVPPEDFPEMKKVLEKNFDRPLDQIFSEIEEIPIAAASLAQVHRAVLRENGSEVALKIQRPGITETIKMDFDILERIAVRLDGRIESLKVYNLPQLVQRIRKLMLQELNFIQEMRNMQVVRTRLNPDEGIVVPDVYPQYCSKFLITMELSRGSKMKDVRIHELKNRATMAKKGVSFSMSHALEYGFFHADPHPGNILIDEDENMILLDWGMVGRLTERVRYELVDLITAVVDNDVEEVTEALISFTTGRENVNRNMIQNEVLEIISHFTSMPLKEINLGQVLMDLTSILRSQGRILTTDLSIMIKSLITAEGTARMLYPDLDVIREAEPIVRRISKERYRPQYLLKGLQKNIRYFYKFQHQLPRQVMDIITQLDRGDLAIRFQHQNLEGLQGTLEKIINRLVIGIIIGTMFLGSGMIIMAGTGPLIWGYPALGLFGYIIAIILSLRLIFSMIRSRKH